MRVGAELGQRVFSTHLRPQKTSISALPTRMRHADWLSARKVHAINGPANG